MLAATQFTTTLTGSQQVPPVVSSGTGTGMVALNAAEDQLIVNLTWSGLTGPAILGHIHGVGAVGVNAGVLFDFAGDVAALASAAGTIPQRVFAITPSQVTELKNGLYYFNVHTNLNPGGEIRGQINGASMSLDREHSALCGDELRRRTHGEDTGPDCADVAVRTGHRDVDRRADAAVDHGVTHVGHGKRRADDRRPVRRRPAPPGIDDGIGWHYVHRVDECVGAGQRADHDVAARHIGGAVRRLRNTDPGLDRRQRIDRRHRLGDGRHGHRAGARACASRSRAKAPR